MAGDEGSAIDTATALARRIAAGTVSAEEAVEASLARIEETDPGVGAWAHVDPQYARAQARLADERRRAGEPLGPLHGVPVGLKDIIDTADFPTECGTALYEGRRPGRDATLVLRLRAAGAVILGKTVTTELATFTPGKTRNPLDPERTPGGSSSGSAAAVSAGMVPLAVGTQTVGSVIRPAAFCGIPGFKPSWGRISRHGVTMQSRRLDTIGVFGRSVDDLALIGDCLYGHDPQDPDCRPMAPPQLAALAAAPPPVTPALAFVRQPAWEERADADTREGFAELVEMLGDTCDTVDLPAPFARGTDVHRTIHLAEMARSFAALHERGRDVLSGRLRALLDEGRGILAYDYQLALDWVELLNAGLDEIFARYDAILTPAAPGEAPVGLDSTGDPVFCGLWTLCGTPAVTLPLLEGAHGLPIGVQVVGARGQDGRLLRTAAWLERTVASQEEEE